MAENLKPADITLQKAAALIQSADSLIITAGAGMGVDSGLPDFRGADGFWRAFPALKNAGLGFRDLASADLFFADPELAWGFYGLRLKSYREVVPHEGFAILRKWAARKPNGHAVFTSNVDGQFQKAGFDDHLIVECHGSVHRLQCTEPCSAKCWYVDGHAWLEHIDPASYRMLGEMPRCADCGAIARPNVLMFNDDRWIGRRFRNKMKSFEDFSLAKMTHPVVIELGAGKTIATVRHFSNRTARQKKTSVIRINPVDFQVGHTNDVGLPLSALEGLRLLDSMMDKS